MCGIVAVTARRDCTEILLEGLRRLEYRGYDSAGLALIDRSGNLQSHKRAGRVAALEAAQAADPIQGGVHCAHPVGDTRRALGCKCPSPYCL